MLGARHDRSGAVRLYIRRHRGRRWATTNVSAAVTDGEPFTVAPCCAHLSHPRHVVGDGKKERTQAPRGRGALRAYSLPSPSARSAQRASWAHAIEVILRTFDQVTVGMRHSSPGPMSLISCRRPSPSGSVNCVQRLLRSSMVNVLPATFVIRRPPSGPRCRASVPGAGRRPHAQPCPG